MYWGTGISNNKVLYVSLPSWMSAMTTVIICTDNDGITFALQVTLTHLWNTRDRWHFYSTSLKKKSATYGLGGGNKNLDVYTNYAKWYACGNVASKDILFFKEHSYRMELPTYLHKNHTPPKKSIFLTLFWKAVTQHCPLWNKWINH